MARIRRYEPYFVKEMSLHHIGLEVSNLQRSVDFYQTTFGAQVKHRVNLDGEELVFIMIGELQLELVEVQSSESENHSVHLAFQSHNITRDVSLMEALGYQLAEGPTRYKNGWQSVFLLGPDSELLEFIQIPDEELA